MSFDVQALFFLNSLGGFSLARDATVIFLATYLPYLLVLAFVGYVFSRYLTAAKRLEVLGIAFIASMLARFGVTALIRYFIHRPRPFSVLPVHQLISDSHWSFPSGHATFFFALATIGYLYSPKWGTGFFVGAILISLGRVMAGVHYPSDILAGAVVGIVVALGVYYTAKNMGFLRGGDTRLSN